MHEQEATKRLVDAVAVTREDIARGKSYVLESGGGKTDELADQWLREQGLTIPRAINADATNVTEVLESVGRAFSVRLAPYQAIWELIAAGELIPVEASANWKPVIDYKAHGYGGGLRPNIGCA